MGWDLSYLAGVRLSLVGWSLAVLACSHPEMGGAPPPHVPPPDPLHLPVSLITQLEDLSLDPDRTTAWLATSTLLAVYRSQVDHQSAESFLQLVLAQSHHPEMLSLYSIWYGDEALAQGRWEEALKRYSQALELAGDRVFVGRPLAAEVLSQRAQAHQLGANHKAAVKDLKEAAQIASWNVAQGYLLRAADAAWLAGDKRQAEALRGLVEGGKPQRPPVEPGGFPPPRRRRKPLPPLEQLAAKAPWQAGVSQRAGGIGPESAAWLRYAVRGFAVGRRADACGRGPAGYYFGRGSHSAKWQGGRDLFAIDFTRGVHQGPAHNNSFGIEVRAMSGGVVSQSYYGTRTHRGVYAPGPTPAPNRVDLLHLTTRVELDEALSLLDVPHDLQLPQAWSSWYLHLVGRETPCAEDGSFCVDAPAQVSFGQYVWQGGSLGFEDSTGLSALDHLHFEVLRPCHARDERCADPDRVVVSVPPILEGKAFREEDTGTCVTSTNHPVILQGAGEGRLPLVMEPLLQLGR